MGDTLIYSNLDMRDTLDRIALMRDEETPFRIGGAYSLHNINDQLRSLKNNGVKINSEKFIKMHPRKQRKLMLSQATEKREQIKKKKALAGDLEYSKPGIGTADYTDTEWKAIKRLYDTGLLVESYKNADYCPFCDTTISRYEVTEEKHRARFLSIRAKLLSINGRAVKDNYIVVDVPHSWYLLRSPYIVRYRESLLTPYRHRKTGETYWTTERMANRVFHYSDYDGVFSILEKDAELVYELELPNGTCTGRIATVDDPSYCGFTLQTSEVIYGTNSNSYTEITALYKLNAIANDFLDKSHQRFYTFYDKGKVQKYCGNCGNAIIRQPRTVWEIRQPDGNWVLSHQHYTGTPLPIWKCKTCGNIEVVGGRKEFAQLVHDAEASEIELYPDTVDEYTVHCKKCNGIMKRVSEVLDSHFDLAVGLIREGWAQYAERVAYIDPKAEQKTHEFECMKALTNLAVPNIDSSFKEYELEDNSSGGVDTNYVDQDTYRWRQLTGNKQADFLKVLSSLTDYYAEQREKHEVELKNEPVKIADLPEWDWLVNEIQNLEVTIGEGGDKLYQNVNRIPWLVGELNSLTHNYKKLIETKPLGDENRDKHTSVLIEMYTCLVELSILLAPFTPNFAEKMNKGLEGEELRLQYKEPTMKESRLARRTFSYLKAASSRAYFRHITLAHQLVNYGLGLRQQLGISLCQPLNKFIIDCRSTTSASQLLSDAKINRVVTDLLKKRLNVNEVDFVRSSYGGASRFMQKYGDAFGYKAKLKKEQAVKRDSKQPYADSDYYAQYKEFMHGLDKRDLLKLKELLKTDGLKDSLSSLYVATYVNYVMFVNELGQNKGVPISALKVECVAKGNMRPLDVSEYSYNFRMVAYDIGQTEEERQKGFCNELIRQYQALRKEYGYKEGERVLLYLQCNNKLQDMLTHDLKWSLLDKTNADGLCTWEPSSRMKRCELTDGIVAIGLKKSSPKCSMLQNN